MPIVNDAPKLKRVNLSGYPESDPGWIEFPEHALMADVEAAYTKTENDMTFVMQLIAALVKNWNFTDKDGATLPISIESLRRMKPEDIKEMREAVESTIEIAPLTAQKKNELTWYFQAEHDAASGKSSQIPVPPIEVVILRYAERFHISPSVVRNTPVQDIQKDLAVLDIEARVIQSNRNTKN